MSLENDKGGDRAQQRIPARFNLAEAICRRHSDRVTRVALLDVKRLAENCYTFSGLDYLSDKFASTLRKCGILEGDALALALDQSAALAVAQLGALKLGAVVVPLLPELADGEVEYAINDSGAKVMVVPFEKRADFARIAGQVDSIKTIFLAGDSREAIHYDGPERSFWRDVFCASADFTTAATAANAPAFIFYAQTADRSLRPVIYSHATVVEQLAAFAALCPQDAGAGGALWGGDDWAAADLLLGLIYPAWWFGWTVVTKAPDGINGEKALQLLQAGKVTTAFLPTGLLNALLHTGADERAGAALKLRTIITRNNVVTADNRRPGATLHRVSVVAATGLLIGDTAMNDFGNQG